MRHTDALHLNIFLLSIGWKYYLSEKGKLNYDDKINQY